jgi:hypothetical protein
MSPNPAIFARVLKRVLCTDYLLCGKTTATALLKSVAAYMDKSKRERLGTLQDLLDAETIAQDKTYGDSQGQVGNLHQGQEVDEILQVQVIDEDQQEPIKSKKSNNVKVAVTIGEPKKLPHRSVKNKNKPEENDPSDVKIKRGKKSNEVLGPPSKKAKVTGSTKKSKVESKNPAGGSKDIGETDENPSVILKPKRKYTKKSKGTNESQPPWEPSHDPRVVANNDTALPYPSTAKTSVSNTAVVPASNTVAVSVVPNENDTAAAHYQFIKNQLKHQYSIDRLRSKQLNSLKRLRNKKSKRDLLEGQRMKSMASKHMRSENALDIQAQQFAHQSALMMTVNPWAMMQQQQWQQQNMTTSAPVIVTSAAKSTKKIKKSSAYQVRRAARTKIRHLLRRFHHHHHHHHHQ